MGNFFFIKNYIMEDVKVLKVKISELFLSNKMQNVMLKNPFIQLEYNDIEKRT